MGRSLTLQDHVNKTFSGAYFHIYNIRHIRTFLTKETTQILVHSLVISGIDYCNSLLFCLPVVITSPNSLSYSASRIQRQDLFPLPHVFIITPVLKSLHWLPVKYRIFFKVAILTFKILHGLSPDYLKELLTIKEISRYNLQSNKELIHRPSIISNLKKTLGDCSFKMAAAPAAV